MVARGVSRLWERVGNHAGAMFVVAVFCGLTMSGCGEIGETLADLFRINGDNGDAEAQDGTEGERRIETFRVDAGSFELVVDAEPMVTISDGTTRYELTSNGTITFILQTGQEQTFPLETGDEVIERPAAGTVTLIRDDDN